MKKSIYLFLMIVSLFMMSACSSNSDTPPPTVEEPTEKTSTFVPDYEWPIASFEAINQDNKPITEKDYQGDVWIMNMIFTNCKTVCLPMTANMVKLQQHLTTQGLDVHLVSFSVDPLYDTADVLKEYAQSYEGDFSNWDLLTGYSEEDIKRIAKSVKTLAEKPEGTDQVTHSTKFFLVNQEGIVVKGYDGVNLPIEQITNDLKSIQPF